MSVAGYLLFLSVYVAAVATPGPGVAAVLARALATGFWRTLPFIAGVAAADLVWFSLTAAGLAMIAERFHGVFLVVKYAGALYLLWLAVKIWRAPVRVGEPPAQARGEGFRLFLGGLSLTMGNPKTMVFFLAILPNLMDVGHTSWRDLALVNATIVIALPMVMMAYAGLADRARRFVANATAQRRLNRGTATLMAGVAAAVAAR